MVGPICYKIMQDLNMKISVQSPTVSATLVILLYAAINASLAQRDVIPTASSLHV